MRTGRRRERIRSVLDACEAYWKRTGVPPQTADEMREELDLHFREAVVDGKSVEDVIGSDTERFAEMWASHSRRPRSLWRETLDVISDTLIALATLVVLAHLFLQEPEFPVDLEALFGAVVFAMIFLRLLAYLRAPAEEPPDSEESVLDRYPRRLYHTFMWSLVAVWAVYLYLPLPDIQLFVWPWQATLAVPVLAVLVRSGKRVLPEHIGDQDQQTGYPGESEQEHREQAPETLDVLLDCELHWLKMRISQQKVEEMGDELQKYIGEAAEDGRSIDSVIGLDVEAFAEAWAEGSGAGPDFSPEPAKYKLQGWVLSVTACSAILAGIYHVLDWTLYVPVAWISGCYLFLLGLSFLGELLDNVVETAKSWRYTPWKSMLAAVGLVLMLVAVSVLGAIFFMYVGPLIPFVWPWYATIVSATVAFLILFSWLNE